MSVEGTIDRAQSAIDREKKRKAKREKFKSEKARFEKAACETFSTEAGQRTLYWLMNECGYQSPSVIVDHESGEVKKESTVYNEARRAVYLNLRSLLRSRPKILSNVEINHLKGE